MRHGLMCVGPTGGGKTTIYEVLKDAIIHLHKDGHQHYFYQPVHTYVLNPKVCDSSSILYVLYMWNVCTYIVHSVGTFKIMFTFMCWPQSFILSHLVIVICLYCTGLCLYIGYQHGRAVW